MADEFLRFLEGYIKAETRSMVIPLSSDLYFTFLGKPVKKKNENFVEEAL